MSELSILGGLVSQDDIDKVTALTKEVAKSAEVADKFIKSWNSLGESSKGGGDTSRKKKDLTEIEELTRRIEKAERELTIQQESNYVKLLTKQNEIKEAKKATFALTEAGMQKEQALADAKAIKEAQAQQKAIKEAQAQQKEMELADAKAKKEEGHLNQLRISVAKLTDEYFRLSKVEFDNAQKGVAGTIGNNTLQELKKQRAELAMAEQAYGNYTKSVGHYSMATKMFGINLGQVLKEAPNFAVSARVGIMSLTNNLPQLAESIKEVVKEHKAMTEAFNEGNGEKPVSIAETITRSLFGLTGIMSLGMVLFQLYGEKVLDWVGKMIIGESAVERMQKVLDGFSESQKAYIKQMEDMSKGTKPVSDELNVLDVLIKTYQKGEGDANAIVEKYNTTLGVHYGKLKTINEVMAEFPSKAKEYLEWTLKMEASIELAREGSTASLKARGAKQTLVSTFKNNDDREELRAYYNELKKQDEEYAIEAAQKEKDNISYLKGIKSTLLTDEEKDEAIKKAHNAFVGNLIKEGDVRANMSALGHGKLLKMEEKFGKDKLNIAMKYIAIENVETAKSINKRNSSLNINPGALPTFKDESGSGGSKSAKVAKSEFVTAEYYNIKRAELVRQLMDIELEASRTTEKGIINSYAERLKATDNYYTKTQEIATIDKEKAIFDADEKLETELRRIEKSRSYNKVNASRIKASDLYKAEVENRKAESTAYANHYKSIQKATDEFNKQEKQGQIAQAKAIFSIHEEDYKERIEQLKRFFDQKGKLEEFEATRARIKLEEKNALELLAQGFTGSGADNSFKELEALKTTTNKKLEIDRKYLEEKLKNARKLNDLEKTQVVGRDAGTMAKFLKEKEDITEKEKSLIIELEEFRDRKSNSDTDLELKYEDLKQKKIQDLKIRFAEKTFAIMQQMTDNYFSAETYKLTVQRAKEKDINDQRTRDVDDRLKAGLISEEEASQEKQRIADYEEGQRRVIEEKKYKLELEKFRVDQAFAISKIAINTAIQATANPLLVPLIIALGIAETGLVLAQKPPSPPVFKDGGVMPYTGVGIVGDGGKHEAIISPDGQITITPATPTKVHMEKGSVILPDANTLLHPKKQAIVNDSNVQMLDILNKIYHKKENVQSINTLSLVGQLYSMQQIKKRRNV